VVSKKTVSAGIGEIKKISGHGLAAKLFRPRPRSGAYGLPWARPAVAAQDKPNANQPGETIVNATAQEIAGQLGRNTVLPELLGEVARGNKSAFATLYGLTNRKLLGVALKILRDRGLAEDALQETYVKIWRSAGSYDPAAASPITWMATIVRHGAIDILRKRQFEAAGTRTKC